MFDWFKNLFSPTGDPDITQSIIAILLTIGLGVFAGRLKIGKVSLGVSAVMFVGLFLGHYGYDIKDDISTFIRDFGLILFVYGIGIQVGPSFFSSFRKEGLKFNILGVGTVLIGGLVTYLIYIFAQTGIEDAVGLMSGAVTNTPGLGAAKSTLHEIQSQFQGKTFNDPAVAYAITYPLGVFGIISMIVLAKNILRIDLNKELAMIISEKSKESDNLVRKKCRILNDSIFGKSI